MDENNLIKQNKQKKDIDKFSFKDNLSVNDPALTKALKT
jgi:hypothetical protein